MGLSVLKPVPGKLGRVSHLKNIHIKLLSKQYRGGWVYPHCSFCISSRVGFHHPHYALGLFHFTSLQTLASCYSYLSFLPELCLRIIPSRFPKSPISHQNLYFLKSHCWSQQDIERKAFHFSAVKRLWSRAPGQGAGGEIHTQLAEWLCKSSSSSGYLTPKGRKLVENKLSHQIIPLIFGANYSLLWGWSYAM